MGSEGEFVSAILTTRDSKLRAVSNRLPRLKRIGDLGFETISKH